MKNRVQLIGHGSRTRNQNLESGRVANFTIATNESYTNAKGEKKWNKPIAPRFRLKGKTVDIIEKLLTKGSHVAIEGKLTHRSYDDKDETNVTSQKFHCE